MTDKQYPPLPDPAPLRVLQAYEMPVAPYIVRGYTADQMRAYVDADRAQRSCPTVAFCGYCGGTMTGNHVSLRFEDQASAEKWFEAFCDLADAALNNPSRPDSPPEGEDK